MPEQDFILMPQTQPLTIAIEPIHNVFHSLLLLCKASHAPGVNEWVTRTSNSLSPELLQQHRLVMIGLHFAVMPEQRWTSVPSYIEHLANSSPQILQDKLLQAYTSIPSLKQCDQGVDAKEAAAFDRQAVLKNVDSYIDFLRERFKEDHIDLELESQAYAYVIDPPAMKELIVRHMRHMWDAYMAPEWQRVLPMLQDAVRAFQQLELQGLSRLEAARTITGQPLEGKEKFLQKAAQIFFVPSAHVGPYLGMLWTRDSLWIMFGARLPEGVAYHAPDLSRAEIIVRLSALVDDNRLRILKFIAESGELSSQDIIAQLGLSQSSASRHLKQLSATGYLNERRCNGAKCYTLNRERIENSLQAVATFLFGN